METVQLCFSAQCVCNNWECLCEKRQGEIRTLCFGTNKQSEKNEVQLKEGASWKIQGLLVCKIVELAIYIYTYRI